MGIHVYSVTQDSRVLEGSLKGKLRAFTSGIYSPSAYRFIAELIKQENPNVAHVHNLYPLFSPSVLVACQRAGVPVVMTYHNYRLTCPIGTHFNDNNVCELCLEGREYRCVLKNCRGNIFESIALAMRSGFARVMGFYHNNVTIFIALTEFSKNLLIAAGIDDNRIVVIPNCVPLPDSPAHPSNGKYAAYVGRISSEKGIDTLLSVLAQLPDLLVQLAGNGPDLPKLRVGAPENTNFLGPLDYLHLSNFYRKARFVIVPSLWFEGCPMVLMEAMSYGLPVIASKIGGLPEIVEDGVTGLLFEPGNSEDLANKMKLLWHNPSLCNKMGQAGREKAIREYSEDAYYKRLMKVYEEAVLSNN
jgi:glycosyltransferase involved in cell wall biosynthesis